MLRCQPSYLIASIRKKTVRCATSCGNEGNIACHPFIIGELACGNLKNKTEILTLLKNLPVATVANDDEVLKFLEYHQLMGKGLGYIDIHQLTSAVLTGTPQWTLGLWIKGCMRLRHCCCRRSINSLVHLGLSPIIRRGLKTLPGKQT